MNMEIKRPDIDYVSCGKIAAAIAVVIGVCAFFVQGAIADAETTSTNTQVVVSYYTGKPSTIKTYEEAYLDGDTNVNKVTYTTKSLGRLQWGEPGADGTYEVYYDAADIHALAAALNQSEEKYMEVYNHYVDAYNAVMH